MFRAVISIFFILIACAVVIAQSASKIEDELLAHIQKLEKASNYGGTSDYDVLSRENKTLRNLLIKYSKRADILAYPFPRLKDKIRVTTSKNGRLRSYSWDTESGGTMHDFITVFQFRDSKGKVKSWAPPYSEDISDYGVGSFIHDIFQTDTSAGPIYLLVSTFIGSTSLSGQTISAFRINGEKLDHNAKVIRTKSGITNSISFEYDFFSVVDRPERPIKLFSFDEKEKSFRFPVVIVDDKAPQGRVTDKFITYKFNGRYFVKLG